MLDDPRVKFAISSRGAAPGLDHLGIQVESEAELQEVYSRLRAAMAIFSKKAKLRVATQSRKSLGSTIRREFRGRLS
jgi:hypothetical protein